MEYIIIHGRDDIDMENSINDHLKRGWKLQGGVSITTVSAYNYSGIKTNSISFAQAMIKEEP
jgi:hypothetical protein